MSKISHLIEVIITLQFKGLTTASELAESLGVDKKTIYRYISSLNEANIPIYTKKGRYGGFCIDEEFYMKPANLSCEELEALLMASEILTKENGFTKEKELKMAVTKIKNLEINNNDKLKIINKNSHFGFEQTGNLENLDYKISKINYSISKGRSLSINYFSINRSNLTIKKIDPYDLIFRMGSWYLIGYCHMTGRIEILKVSRIQSLKTLNEIYIKPHDFFLKDYLDDLWAAFNGEKIKVSIKFCSHISDFIRNGRWHIDQNITDLEDGSVVLDMYLDDIRDVKSWILSFGKYAEVIEPKKLREEVKEELRELYIKY